MLDRGGPRTRIGVAEGGAAESPARPPLPVLEASPPGLRTSTALPAAARPGGRAPHAPACSQSVSPQGPGACRLCTRPGLILWPMFIVRYARNFQDQGPCWSRSLPSCSPWNRACPCCYNTVSLMPSLSGPFTPILMAQSAPPPQVSSPSLRLYPTQVPLGTVPASGQHRGVWGPALWPGEAILHPWTSVSSSVKWRQKQVERMMFHRGR